jgi:hypothetical protein
VHLVTGPGTWPPELTALVDTVEDRLDRGASPRMRHFLDQERARIEDRLAALDVPLHSPDHLRAGLALCWVLVETWERRGELDARWDPRDVLAVLVAGLLDHLPVEARG